MGLIRVSVTVEAAWTDQTELRLMVGTESAANLAASVPAGGTVAAVAEVGDTASGDVVVLEHEHRAADKCGTLPVGVVAVDAAGNVSAVTETTVQMADLPAAVGRPDVSSAASGEITLTWTASPDV
ncbi:MAG: hypothetical protein AAGA29_05935 [Planctomycetota bacterium]